MLRSSLLIGLLAISAAATAEDFDYNYLSLGYGTFNFDNPNVDGNGLGLAGSMALNESWHLFGGYESASLDFGVDATAWSAGFGYNAPISDTMDFVARLSYEYVELDPPGPGSFDDSGLGAFVGLRYAASEELEFNGGIKHVDLGDGGDSTGIGLGMLYDLSENVSVGLSGDWDDDASAYTISGRWYFGK